MKSFIQELEVMRTNAAKGTKHHWHGKDLMQITNLAFIHDVITREEKDSAMPIAEFNPYNLSQFIGKLKTL